MLLHSAHFENFRILRDIEIRFSTDRGRPVTVVRGENESGKTTLLTALQWAFFGDDSLPRPVDGSRYNLIPIDWDASAAPQADIVSEVEFEVTRSRTVHGTTVTSTDTFLLRRTAVEEVDGDGNGRRMDNKLVLFEVTDDGYKQATNPHAVLQDFLPSALREVFFTDGDRALEFIAAAKDTKRDKVRAAIKGLLGLDLMEQVHGHLQTVIRNIRHEIKSGSTSDVLKQVLEKEEALTGQAEELKEHLEGLTKEITETRDSIVMLDTRIVEALRLGDREEMARKLQSAQDRLKRERKRQGEVSTSVSDALNDGALFTELVSVHVAKTAALLKDLKDKGTIPKNFLPILEEQVKAGVCICGASLRDGTAARTHVLELIEAHREQDDTKDRLTTLNALLQSRQTPGGPSAWSARIRDLVGKRQDADKGVKDAEEEVRDLDTQLKKIPESDVPTLRKAKLDHEEIERKLRREQATKELKLEGIETQLIELRRQAERHQKAETKQQRHLANERAALDLQAIVTETHEVLKTVTLQEVSTRMNHLFLEMINVDPEVGGLIKSARITPDFDIFVTGPGGRTLDPDWDLNGASRRALTLAFVLALTTVSQVEAPNVIDTPLGMMSGAVKTSVYRVAARESSQLVLFLTRDEIKGIEDVIDETAGVIQTVTNSAHYPTMLRRDPEVPTMQVLVCECNHRQTCDLCQRVTDPLD